MSFHCYDENDDEIARSVQFTATTKDMAVALYNNYVGKTTATATKVKTLVTDMFNLGAEAQKYFAKRNATGPLNTIELPNEGWSQEFVSANYGVLATTNTTSIAGPVVTSSARLSVAPGFTYSFTNTGAGSAANVSVDVQFYNSVTKTTYEKTFSSSAGTLNFYNNAWMLAMADVPFYGGQFDITATFKVDGNEIFTNVYCLETSLNANISNPNTADLLTAIAKFGKACQAYRNL